MNIKPNPIYMACRETIVFDCPLALYKMKRPKTKTVQIDITSKGSIKLFKTFILLDPNVVLS